MEWPDIEWAAVNLFLINYKNYCFSYFVFIQVVAPNGMPDNCRDMNKWRAGGEARRVEEGLFFL